MYVHVCVCEVCDYAWITESMEKTSHLAGWLSASPGDGLQLWHWATVVKGRDQLEQDQLLLYHPSFPNGSAPSEHVQKLTKRF